MTVPVASVLIVDDESVDRRLLETLLRPEGYITRCAAGGKEALDLVAKDSPDLILLDVAMPDMDGYAVAEALKHDPATSRIPIILVTALDDRDARLAGLAAGAEDFLTKPLDRAELWLRVRNLLRLKTVSDLLEGQSSILEEQVQARTAELQRFRSAMDATADAIVVVERATMQIVEINATASDMLGYTRAELLGMTPAQLHVAREVPLEVLYDTIIGGHRTNELSETELLRKDGTLLPVEIHQHAQRLGNDWFIVAVLHDITEHREFEERLHRLAHYDMLTGLSNRTLFYEALARVLRDPPSKGSIVAVLVMDLDHFKDINDNFGHAIGDELLRGVGARLVQCVGIQDTVGRLSGDEFAVIMTELGDQQGAAAVARKIRGSLAVPFTLRGHKVNVTASIGIAVHPDDGSDPETLIKYADTAMFLAKQAGRDSLRFFTAQMNVDVSARLDLEAALRQAVENDEFVLYYQPKLHLGSGQISGLEALLRWHRPGHGVVLPGDFIPVLEETGMIVDVGSWVIASVCEQMATWSRSSIGPVHVAVNIAARQFVEGDLDKEVLDALGKYGVVGELLELELTESALMVNTERTVGQLKNLKRSGLQVSIDDFGTGYSSLAYLRRFPIDKLKIDSAFIRGITNDPDDAAIALTIIRMAHSLQLVAIAEGVETAAQLDYLDRLGCDEVQGYYFSRPLPVSKIERMLREDIRRIGRGTHSPASANTG